MPGHTTNALPNGAGVLLHAGAKIVMQVHYNLIEATGPDRSQAQLRLRPATAGLTPLETQLVAAPVELPCPAGVSGPKCGRQQALQDEVDHYGAEAAFIPAALLRVCNKTLADYPTEVGTGTAITTSCDRAVTRSETIYGVAGHMHLRGRDIKVVLDPGVSKEQTLLHIPAWDFHWQDVYYLMHPVAIGPGDTIRIQDRVVYVNGQVFPNPPHAKFMRNETASPGLASPYIFPRGSGFNEDNYGPLVVPRRGSRLLVKAENFSEWEVFIQREGQTAELRGREVFIDGRAASEHEVQRDYAFAMGDSRDNSLDSRFWGFVPLEDIIGTPMIVYWSWDQEIPAYDLFHKLASIRFNRIGKIIR